MIIATTNSTVTPLTSIVSSLRAASNYNRHDQVAPVVVLWTDKESQWQAVIPMLQEELPQLLIFGDYIPEKRSGPAIWIKCMVARTIEAGWNEADTPIIYLPGVSRQELRAVEECDKSLQPLAELQYRGVFWSQQNGRDWTVSAFLQSKDGGLGLDLGKDAATLESIQRVLTKLVVTSTDDLKGRRLDAGDFDRLVMPDPERDILLWLNDPMGFKARIDQTGWESFRHVCVNQYKYDPQNDGELIGAEKLASQQGQWAKVWDRFAESPKRYPNIPALLRSAKPAKAAGLFVTEASPTWPQDNDAMEAELRSVLIGLRGQNRADALKKLREMEAHHGARRGWVWAELGQAVLAQALLPLLVLAETVQTLLPGATPDALADAYTNGGWKADEAVVDCLASLKSGPDVEVVNIVIRELYGPWMEDSANRLQGFAAAGAGLRPELNREIEKGTVYLFADGLRFDVGKKLKRVLDEKGLTPSVRWHWVALPSVTATAKPAVSPIADLLGADEVSEEFRPFVSASNKTLTTDRFRQLLAERGIQFLAAGDTGDPKGMAWTEVGDLDDYGHNHGWKLARRVEEIIGEMSDRVVSLVESGWRKLKIVTDHGWLLFPGGLPKSDMPGYLADSRWGRCAILKTTSSTNAPIVPWHWSPHVRIAVAPGITAFKKGLEYAHGGVSLQECVAIELTIEAGGKTPSTLATIKEVQWFGLRCRVRTEGSDGSLNVDLRTKAGDEASSITTAKPVAIEGVTSLFVEDDSLEGTAVTAVLISGEGRVIAKLPTTVGG